MNDEHVTRRQILDYIEGMVHNTENATVWSHIEHCASCTELFDELLLNAASEGSVQRHVNDDDDDADNSLFEALLNDADVLERDARAAEALYVQLRMHHATHEWEGVIGLHPHVCTSALVQRLVDAAELERKPAEALVMLRVAETVTYLLQDAAASMRARGHVWRQRAHALRRLARYEDAIDAAYVAEKVYAALREPDTPFHVGQARYAMAATLFEMTRNDAALRAAHSARELLVDFGTSIPLAKVTMLEALIRAECGDVTSARETLRTLLPIEQGLGHAEDVARVQYNLAECNLRLGDLDAAETEARAAIAAFRNLGNVAEETRGEWTIALIRLARGETEALGRLNELAAVYQDLGMPGEAGFVNLDLTAELLEREEWTEAAPLARDLVNLFTSAGVTLASVNALEHLRRAVENREATPATVRYVRAFVAADDPKRPFDPPAAPQPY